MFNSLKIKLHIATRIFQKKPKPEFVNPYTPAIPEPTSKINPYITDYGTKKKKSIDELIMERVGVVKAGVKAVPAVVSLIPQEPTFTDDMKEMFKDDLMRIATRFANRPKKERIITSHEILRACENTKWQ